MADEVQGIPLELEDQPPEPAPVETPAAPVDATADPNAAPAEVDAVEVGGQKYVPLSAVQKERERRQTAEARATDTDALRRQVDESRPYVEFLKAHPELLRPQAPPEPVANPQDDPLLVELAQSLDFYTPDGKIDTGRAAKHLKIVQSTAQQIANQAIQPWANATAQERSAANFQQAVAWKDASGQPIFKTQAEVNMLRQAWSNLPAASTADPQVAATLVATVAGVGRLQQPARVAPAPNAPLVSEASGGRTQQPQRMSEMEHRIAKERGLTDKDWTARTSGFTPGRASNLEE